jgi:hypothetical protein
MCPRTAVPHDDPLEARTQRPLVIEDLGCTARLAQHAERRGAAPSDDIGAATLLAQRVGAGVCNIQRIGGGSR